MLGFGLSLAETAVRQAAGGGAAIAAYDQTFSDPGWQAANNADWLVWKNGDGGFGGENAPGDLTYIDGEGLTLRKITGTAQVRRHGLFNAPDTITVNLTMQKRGSNGRMQLFAYERLSDGSQGAQITMTYGGAPFTIIQTANGAAETVTWTGIAVPVTSPDGVIFRFRNSSTSTAASNRGTIQSFYAAPNPFEAASPPAVLGGLANQTWTIDTPIATIAAGAAFAGAASYRFRAGSPSVPGITIDTATGDITGTATDLLAQTAMVIEAINLFGAATVAMQVEVGGGAALDPPVATGALPLVSLITGQAGPIVDASQFFTGMATGFALSTVPAEISATASITSAGLLDYGTATADFTTASITVTATGPDGSDVTGAPVKSAATADASIIVDENFATDQTGIFVPGESGMPSLALRNYTYKNTTGLAMAFGEDGGNAQRILFETPMAPGDVYEIRTTQNHGGTGSNLAEMHYSARLADGSSAGWYVTSTAPGDWTGVSFDGAGAPAGTAKLRVGLTLKGTVAAPPELGAPAWAPATAYSIGQVVAVDDINFYTAAADHISAAEFQSDLDAGNFEFTSRLRTARMHYLFVADVTATGASPVTTGVRPTFWTEEMWVGSPSNALDYSISFSSGAGGVIDGYSWDGALPHTLGVNGVLIVTPDVDSGGVVEITGVYALNGSLAPRNPAPFKSITYPAAAALDIDPSGLLPTVVEVEAGWELPTILIARYATGGHTPYTASVVANPTSSYVFDATAQLLWGYADTAPQADQIITVRVTDALGATADHSFTLKIVAPYDVSTPDHVLQNGEKLWDHIRTLSGPFVAPYVLRIPAGYDFSIGYGNPSNALTLTDASKPIIITADAGVIFPATLDMSGVSGPAIWRDLTVRHITQPATKNTYAAKAGGRLNRIHGGDYSGFVRTIDPAIPPSGNSFWKNAETFVYEGSGIYLAGSYGVIDGVKIHQTYEGITLNKTGPHAVHRCAIGPVRDDHLYGQQFQGLSFVHNEIAGYGGNHLNTEHRDLMQIGGTNEPTCWGMLVLGNFMTGAGYLTHQGLFMRHEGWDKSDQTWEHCYRHVRIEHNIWTTTVNTQGGNFERFRSAKISRNIIMTDPAAFSDGALNLGNAQTARPSELTWSGNVMKGRLVNYEGWEHLLDQGVGNTSLDDDVIAETAIFPDFWDTGKTYRERLTPDPAWLAANPTQGPDMVQMTAPALPAL